MSLRSTVIKDDVPTVLFPIDIIVRELESKLVMASALAAHGCRAIFGHKEEISYIGKHSGPIVWHGKELFSQIPASQKNCTADQLIRNGSAIVYIQDEGAMFQTCSWKEHVIEKHQLDVMKTKTINRLCTWGRTQAKVMSDHSPEMADRIRVTGSARFDICTPRFEWITRPAVSEIKKHVSPYILVCTRFGSIAHADGIHHFFRQKFDPRLSLGSIDKKQVEDMWFTKWRQDAHDFAEFVVLINELAHAYPKYTIILRAHPTETEIFYQHAFSQVKNIEVTRVGNVINWIRGADLVVHSNCTTGVEAVMAGRPVLNFLPGEQDRSNLNVEVACEAGAPTRSIHQALETAGALLTGERHALTWSSHAKSVLNNLQTDAVPLLLNETLAVIRERGIDRSRIVLPPGPRAFSIGKFVDHITGRKTPATNRTAALKRGPLDRTYAATILDGCRAMRIGAGRIREFSTKYMVIDPE
jgi:surface carbohydrate biosynthesis protein